MTPVLRVTSFGIFATLVVAACKLAPRGAAPADRAATLVALAANPKTLDGTFATPGLAAVAAEIARAAEDQALHFTHPGRARDDAIALFWQVAPLAFVDPAIFAGDTLDPARIADRMVTAIRASPLGRDFSETVLAEPFFRAVALGSLHLMAARSGDR